MIYLAFSYSSIITEEGQQSFQIHSLRTTDNMKHSDLTVHELISLQLDAVERVPILLHTQKNTG